MASANMHAVSATAVRVGDMHWRTATVVPVERATELAQPALTRERRLHSNVPQSNIAAEGDRSARGISRDRGIKSAQGWIGRMDPSRVLTCSCLRAHLTKVLT